MKREAAKNPKMDKDLFKYLPSEIIINIVSRLPVRTVMSCKCVNKPWLNLLTSPEFVKSHISESVPGIIVRLEGEYPKPYNIIQFVDEVDRNYFGHRWNRVFNFDLPFREVELHGSANGLLFMFNNSDDPVLYNPVTRDYVTLPSPEESESASIEIFGFGVSRFTCQYKLVRIFINERPFPLPMRTKRDQFECEVYTVGTASWRKIAVDSPVNVKYDDDMIATTPLNGNLHWLLRKYQILCFNLETELFSTFSAPRLDDPDKDWNFSVLGDCLCVCDYSEDEFMLNYVIEIWLMKEYGDEKSWTKQFVIRKDDMDETLGFPCPDKVFKDGDILMVPGSNKMLCYSNKTKNIRLVGLSAGLEIVSSSSPIFCTPSFLSLKSFGMENVSSFFQIMKVM